ncbi:MAG: HEAT repeat domain-containing protein [Elusimicrobia bacterium]|nr:HEAT repeat domain-containing protein [Elusimicrobiota bacterium]
MRKAWLLGVFLFLPRTGQAALGGVPAEPAAKLQPFGSAKELSLLLNTGELPPIASAPIMEVEKLGEDLRDAVAPVPSLTGLLAALRDPDPRERGEAVAAFGYEGNFAAIPYVSAVLLRLDEPLFVRVAAAQALGRIGDRRAWSFLARAVRDPEPQVRLACAIALGRLSRWRGVRPLSRALRSETDESVRVALTWALGAAQRRRL